MAHKRCREISRRDFTLSNNIGKRESLQPSCGKPRRRNETMAVSGPRAGACDGRRRGRKTIPVQESGP